MYHNIEMATLILIIFFYNTLNNYFFNKIIDIVIKNMYVD